VTLNRDFIGRTLPPGEIYEVSREKIREYALALDDTNPVYLDREAAGAVGHSDVIAPPTFAHVVLFRLGGWPLYDPDFGKQTQPVCVHRLARVVHHRPIQAGDRLVLTTTVDDIHDIGPHEQFVLTSEIAAADGEPVCTVVSHIVSRGTAAPKGVAR